MFKRALACIGVIAFTLGAITVGAVPANSQTDAPIEEPPPVDENGVSPDARDAVLGEGWAESEDVAHVVLSDRSGLTVLAAHEDDGYAWSAIASVPIDSTVDTDLWIANSCVTSDGRHLVVVFAPRAATNDPAQFGNGASAAIVDLASGRVTSLGSGYTIAYFNPGCGSGNSVSIARYSQEFDTTYVAAVDAVSGTVITRTELVGTATSTVSDAAGTIYASTKGGIVAIPRDGEPAVLVASDYLTYDLSLDEHGRLGYMSLKKLQDIATASIVNVDGLSKPIGIASGSVLDIGIRSNQSGGFFLTGSELTEDAVNIGDVQALPAAGPNSTISSQGSLVVDSVLPAGLGRAAEADAGSAALESPRIDAVAAASGEVISFELESVPVSDDLIVTGELRAPDAITQGPAVMGDPTTPLETERSCAVPRNDPNSQAYQPKPRQVEWAVDRAVLGQLTESRPSNWRGLGMPSYAPQAYFPRVSLVGGGTIPPQIVLGVLMQESNMWQASRFTTPGNTGNPLIGNYYANRDAPSIWDIDFPEADCGYGIGQITDGMRLAGQERPGQVPALPVNQQRAIALDYEANIAMTVRMLGQKWNEVANAGMQINNGNANRLENWFFAVWTYNTGFHPYLDASTPWGVGWFNNPINPIYDPNRGPFLEASQGDAVTPQFWPYAEKVMGWAAWGTSLVETEWSDPGTREYEQQFVSSFSLAWWNTEVDRSQVKPPRTLFCSLLKNHCDPSSADPCQITGEPECWYHDDASWKTACNTSCGNGNERFDSSYSTEASSMSSSLPAVTLQSSHLANCSAPPTGVVVVDNTSHPNARNPGECAHQNTAGSFQFSFTDPDSNGSYPAKVDVHQQGGGFNGHFWFAHMQANSSMAGYPGERATVTGTWNRGANMNNQWTRIWVHVPDYAAWTQQAAYTINFGDGTSQTRYLPQRRYANEWVSLGVFQMKGTPSVSLSNVLASDYPPISIFDNASPLSGEEDVAWDAVGFEPLSVKPADFVVALGDSFSSGEGAGSYYPWSDNNGSFIESRNACHQSTNAWIRKTTLPGDTASIGSMADAPQSNDSMDFHFLACSGAESENLLPFITAGSSPPANGEGQQGIGQWSTVSQLDAGYLDSNTTLVTLSIGGNDLRFVPILSGCVLYWWTTLTGDCTAMVLPGDTFDVVTESQDRVVNELHYSLETIIDNIRSRAPNAQIALVGYPELFETGGECITVSSANTDWLNDLSEGLNGTLAFVAAQADLEPGPDVFFVDPRPNFAGHNLCAGTSGINQLDPWVTPGEDAWLLYLSFLANGSIVSQTSVHPNNFGNELYSDALEAALALHP